MATSQRVKDEESGIYSRERSTNKWVAWYILSVALMLLTTGMAKIISALGESAVLKKPDPILGIPFHYLLLSTGFVELIVATVCIFFLSQRFALMLVAVLSLNFLAYRIGLWVSHWDGYCPCLGTLTASLHLSPQRADLISRVILCYILFGSCLLLACKNRIVFGKMQK